MLNLVFVSLGLVVVAVAGGLMWVKPWVDDHGEWDE